MSRTCRFAATLLVLGFASGAHAALLSDSTVADAWRLDNGLEVRTRHVPGAAGVAVTLAVRAGRGYDPAGREGLSELLAELAFMSAAGNFPERTRDEMTSLRPLGWESRPGARLVQFTEIATPGQLPGVLQQFATRLGGVTLTEAGVKTALASVRRDAGERLFGEVADVLYWRAAAQAQGLDDNQLLRSASLSGLAKLGPRDIAPLLKRWYHAGNASLALAGDLSSPDIRAAVDALFGALPGGEAMPDTVQLRLSGSSRTTPWKNLAAPAGVIALTAPALSDSLHPSFFLGMLITGPGVTHSWGPPTPPLATRFQYSIMDEPELVRFYPPVRADATDPDVVAGALHDEFQVVGGQLVNAPMYDLVRKSVRWLLGAGLPPELLLRMQKDPGGLGTLASGMATRALWMGDEFWAGYLARFDRQLLGHNYFYSSLTDPSHQTVLLLTPAR